MACEIHESPQALLRRVPPPPPRQALVVPQLLLPAPGRGRDVAGDEELHLPAPGRLSYRLHLAEQPGPARAQPLAAPAPGLAAAPAAAGQLFPAQLLPAAALFHPAHLLPQRHLGFSQHAVRVPAGRLGAAGHPGPRLRPPPVGQRLAAGRFFRFQPLRLHQRLVAGDLEFQERLRPAPERPAGPGRLRFVRFCPTRRREAPTLAPGPGRRPAAGRPVGGRPLAGAAGAAAPAGERIRPRPGAAVKAAFRHAARAPARRPAPDLRPDRHPGPAGAEGPLRAPLVFERQAGLRVALYPGQRRPKTGVPPVDLPHAGRYRPRLAAARRRAHRGRPAGRPHPHPRRPRLTAPRIFATMKAP
jgi:hypothetical protein